MRVRVWVEGEGYCRVRVIRATLTVRMRVEGESER